MRICVDGREFVSGLRTGIGRYLEGLLTSIADESDVEITLLVNSEDSVPAVLKKRDISTVVLPHLPTQVVDQVILPELARKKKADVFFSPYYKTPFQGRFKKVITVHDITFLRLPGPLILKRRLAAAQLRMAVRCADMILTDSQFSRDDLVAFVPGSAPKTRVLYPPIDPTWCKPVESSIAENVREHFANRCRFFIYVGNFKPHKNVDLLVESFLKLKADGGAQDHCLVLAGGDDVNAQRIQELINASEGRNSIMVHRNVSDEDLKALYAAADWFVTASRYEGFGYPVLEAMAIGCPVMCHPNTSLPEITADAVLNINALNATAVADALERASRMSTQERQALVSKGKTRAAVFCSDQTAKNFLGLLSGLVGTQLRNP